MGDKKDRYRKRKEQEKRGGDQAHRKEKIGPNNGFLENQPRSNSYTKEGSGTSRVGVAVGPKKEAQTIDFQAQGMFEGSPRKMVKT